MKNTLKEKFKNNVIVKPLYRKLKDGNKVEPTVLITVDRTFKLDGHAITVKRNIVNDNDNSVLNKAKTSNRVFRCVRDQSNQSDIFEKINHERKSNGLRKTYKMLSGMENKRPSEVDDVDDGTNKLVQADYNHILVTQAVSKTIKVNDECENDEYEFSYFVVIIGTRSMYISFIGWYFATESETILNKRIRVRVKLIENTNCRIM